MAERNGHGIRSTVVLGFNSALLLCDLSDPRLLRSEE